MSTHWGWWVTFLKKGERIYHFYGAISIQGWLWTLFQIHQNSWHGYPLFSTRNIVELVTWIIFIVQGLWCYWMCQCRTGPTGRVITHDIPGGICTIYCRPPYALSLSSSSSSLRAWQDVCELFSLLFFPCTRYGNCLAGKVNDTEFSFVIVSVWKAERDGAGKERDGILRPTHPHIFWQSKKYERDQKVLYNRFVKRSWGYFLPYYRNPLHIWESTFMPL